MKIAVTRTRVDGSTKTWVENFRSGDELGRKLAKDKHLTAIFPPEWADAVSVPEPLFFQPKRLDSFDPANRAGRLDANGIRLNKGDYAIPVGICSPEEDARAERCAADRAAMPRDQYGNVLDGSEEI